MSTSETAGTSFVVLFSIVGLALWGLPFFYDFMVQQFGWTRGQVTSGNALSKLLVGPLFGFFAGWVVDRFGPRRLMMAGILMAGIALIGLGSISTLGFFYFFYMFNALGYVCGGPLPVQVLLSNWFDKSRGKAMGFAYLGIGFATFIPLILPSSSIWWSGLRARTCDHRITATGILRQGISRAAKARVHCPRQTLAGIQKHLLLFAYHRQHVLRCRKAPANPEAHSASTGISVTAGAHPVGGYGFSIVGRLMMARRSLSQT
jgi:MFS family permease